MEDRERHAFLEGMLGLQMERSWRGVNGVSPGVAYNPAHRLSCPAPCPSRLQLWLGGWESWGGWGRTCSGAEVLGSRSSPTPTAGRPPGPDQGGKRSAELPVHRDEPEAGDLRWLLKILSEFVSFGFQPGAGCRTFLWTTTSLGFYQILKVCEREYWITLLQA